MITFGREITGDLHAALRREWLVTNGLGSYAMGTVGGANTRRYHGLLIAALKPPLGRTVLLARFNETARINGTACKLTTNEYAGKIIDPPGYRYLETFHLDGTIPVFTYNLAEALLEKRIWMAYGQQTTYITYTLRRTQRPVTLELVPLVTYRDHHAIVRGTEWIPTLTPRDRALQITAFEGATPYYLHANLGEFHTVGACWHYNFLHRAESERGLDDIEDYFAAGTFVVTLQPDETLTLAASLEARVELDGEKLYASERTRHSILLNRSGLTNQPHWVRQLVLAADQFLVKRTTANQPAEEGRRALPPTEGMTVIAGYPWFGDWGRDTMIALPGLTLKTGRPEIAGQILRTFARFVDQGMLPNNFPDESEAPQYNTVDATLWYFQAIEDYYANTGDRKLIEDLYPVLTDIVEWHLRGTRYSIQVDPQDGLLHAGEPSVQLTWMDAKIDEWVVTPRTGKAVEINALWYNALMVLAAFGDRLGRRRGPGRYLELATRVRAGFDRFWYAKGGYLYDVIDGPRGADHSLRPNQLLALGLTHTPCPNDRARAVVTVCAQHLLTSLGLRTLTPEHADYVPRFTGGVRQRDSAYHQGTTWAWLIGPFVTAHYRAFGDAEAARTFLRPIEAHLSDAGLGSISEVFDGDAPFTPGGCTAQAWSVAEVLRAWIEVDEA